MWLPLTGWVAWGRATVIQDRQLVGTAASALITPLAPSILGEYAVTCFHVPEWEEQS